MNTPHPPRSTPGGAVYNDIRNLARRHGRPPAEYFTFYVLEAFLARLSRSPTRDDFVLKGGVLMPAYTSRRPTRDIDLATVDAYADDHSAGEIIDALMGPHETDAVVFDPDIRPPTCIREGQDMEGIRFYLVAHLATAAVPFHLDLTFGEPIWPGPSKVTIPRLLGGSIEILGYPDHMVLAEKIVTACEKGPANTRWRDFWDIYTLTRARWVRGHSLQEAISAIARYRLVSPLPFWAWAEKFDRASHQQWAVWVKKQNLPDHVGPDFEHILRACAHFADPALMGRAATQIWDPHRLAWRREMSECRATAYDVGLTCRSNFPLVARDSRSR